MLNDFKSKLSSGLMRAFFFYPIQFITLYYKQIVPIFGTSLNK